MSEFKEFEINDWVKAKDGQFGFTELFKIIDFFADRNGTLLAVLDDGDCHPLSSLEHASEAEIKAGHRIDDCSACNGRGEVGNVLDGDTCQYCKDSGVELETLDKPENHISTYCKSRDV